MTDKVQKIRNEVERLQNELIQEREKGYGSDVDDACILELQNVLTYIDILQEEPVSENLDSFAIKYAQDKPYPVTVCQAVKAGANWQKEEMMAKAIDAQCFGFQCGALFSFRLPASNYLVGSEVKVIVIKK